MTLKTDLRTTDTKDRIIKEAQRLYETGGYTQINLDKITKMLDIKRPALYYHFPGGKEQLLGEVAKAFTSQKIAAWEAAIRAGHDTRSCFRNMLDTMIGHPLPDSKRAMCSQIMELGEDFRVAIQEGFAQMYSLVTGVFQAGIERGEIRPVDLHIAFFSFMGLCDQIEDILVLKEVFPLIRHKMDTPDMLVQKMFDLWMDGLAMRPCLDSK
jgi:AcrR family transcriptional regulator